MSYSALLSAIAAMVVLLSQEAAVSSPTAIALGNCADFAIMGGTAVWCHQRCHERQCRCISWQFDYRLALADQWLIGSQLSQCTNLCCVDVDCQSCHCQNTATPAILGGLTLIAGVYCNAGGYFLINSGKLTLTGMCGSSRLLLR